MGVLNSKPGGVLDARFLRAIEAWCAENGMSTGAFGAAALRDRGFVASLRDGRNPRLKTVDRALAVMGEPPAGPAFRGEVEAFLAVTGVKRSLLGREATGNPSFVAQLLGGVSLKLATVEAVRASTKSHASADEWREIRARTGLMPAILIANMVQGEDGRWRTMANEKLYSSKMLIGALYRSELARELGKLSFALKTSGRSNSAVPIPSFVISTTPGHRRCTRSRGARSIT